MGITRVNILGVEKNVWILEEYYSWQYPFQFFTSPANIERILLYL